MINIDAISTVIEKTQRVHNEISETLIKKNKNQKTEFKRSLQRNSTCVDLSW